MSTPTERAADVNRTWIWERPASSEKFARAILTAALTDPDDPDALAGYVREHTPATEQRSGVSRCECGRPIVDAADWSRHVAAAVRAWLLGEDL